MELIRIVLLLMLLACFIYPNNAELFMKFYNTECKYNPKYVANGTCDLDVYGRDLVRANVDYDLIRSMRNVTALIKLLKFYNQFRPHLINEYYNLCKADNKAGFESYNFFVKFFIRILKKFSNAIICNHEPKHYYFRNIDVKFEQVKFLFEAGKYKIVFEVYEGYPFETVGNYSLSLEVYEKNVWRKGRKRRVNN